MSATLSATISLPAYMGNPLFSVYSLTAVLNRVPYMPGLIGNLDLFSPRPLTTNVALLEVGADRLALVPEQPRGAPANRNVMGGRGVYPFLVPHFPLSDTVMADSILGVRAFGSDNQLEAINDVIAARLMSMSRKHDVTLEHLRLGAVKGVVITSVDRETGLPVKSIDLFQQFGITAPPVLPWPIIYDRPMTEADAWSGPIRGLVLEVQQQMAAQLGATPLTAIACICGSTFYNAVAAAPEVRQTYLNTPQASDLRSSLYGLSIAYAGCLFQQYLGGVGAYQFIQPDMAYFFPMNVPELFIECYAPAPYLETVNTVALRRYAKQEVMDFDKGVEIETQQNVLPLCTMPQVLVSAQAVDVTTLGTRSAPPPRLGESFGGPRLPGEDEGPPAGVIKTTPPPPRAK